MTLNHPFKTFKHCPRCGGRLGWKTESLDEPKRQTCVKCGYRVYHNPVAAVEAYIVRDGQVLLVKRNREPRKGFWDVPGGFLELGEDPVAGLKREVEEEMQASIVKPRLFGGYGSGYYFQHELTSVVILTYTATLRGKIKLNHENLAYDWVPFRQAHRLAFTHQQRALKDLQKLMKATT